MQLLTLVVLLTFIGRSAATGTWGYGKTRERVNGPADWGHVYKDCDGSSQSPVNIVTSGCNYDRDDDHPLRVQFAGKTSGSMTNNGLWPTFSVETGGATFKNPINGQTYKLEQFHFHFGCDDSVGSEHTVNGKSYPGEMHLGFFNTKYGDVGTAATQPDGLTIIGVFLEKAENGIAGPLLLIAYETDHITTEGATTNAFNILLQQIVPGLESGVLDYHSYKGSLTSPGCNKPVSWLVLKDPIKANDYVFKQFRKLEATHGYYPGKMCNNFRPTQPLNGRKITLHNAN